ncbi:hypothetical protein IscW_ISCW014719 [Ixodes scapularis]|uniref:Uncharacterized protein n=1 Tax=Ixodes scapularis TaxID=6945 RepID=B7QLB1_IXOSC|nr:hypothetical protein IscW_ISCW014719 [Ixodes scapularis]|eukprot:XP_002415965.1 hypothetical protein IscW_ISCW014719 [Ixodes scapularis]
MGQRAILATLPKRHHGRVAWARSTADLVNSAPDFAVKIRLHVVNAVMSPLHTNMPAQAKKKINNFHRHWDTLQRLTVHSCRYKLYLAHLCPNTFRRQSEQPRTEDNNGRQRNQRLHRSCWFKLTHVTLVQVKTMDLTSFHLHNIRHMAYAFCTQYHYKKKAEHLNNKKKNTNLSNIVTGTAALLSHTALITGTITSNKSALFNNVHTSPAAVEAPQVCLMLDNQALLPLFYVSNVVHQPKRAKASRMRFTELQTGKGSVFKFDRTCS